jgi:hypothetical protein
MSMVTISPAWGADVCRRQELDLKTSQRKLDIINAQIDRAKTRVDGAKVKQGYAEQNGRTLVANAKLQANNARALSAAVTAGCAANVLIGFVTRNPARVTYGGRQYACAQRSIQSLIRGITLAESLISRAETRAAAMKDRADGFVARMEERQKDYENQRVPLLEARDKDAAARNACRQANPAA